MCQSMIDIQPAAAEIRRGKKKIEEHRKKSQGKNIMVCPIPQGDHNNDASLWHSADAVNAISSKLTKYTVV